MSQHVKSCFCIAKLKPKISKLFFVVEVMKYVKNKKIGCYFFFHFGFSTDPRIDNEKVYGCGRGGGKHSITTTKPWY
jgi:hypothetical protein